jgi:hypothetical protein
VIRMLAPIDEQGITKPLITNDNPKQTPRIIGAL